MRVIRRIPTPWHPYAVTFSRDGSRLAVGGGSWYGHGGILLVRLDDGHREMLRWDGVPGVAVEELGGFTSAPSTRPTVSGLSFSDNDRCLAASTWLSRQHYGPTILFYVDGMALEYRRQYERDFDRLIDPCPTGVLLHTPYLITRHHGGDPQGNDVIALDPLPQDVAARNTLQHLTHHRVIAVRDTAITEAGGSRGMFRRPGDLSYAPAQTPEGLALRDLRAPDAPLRLVEVEDCHRITAIAALPGNASFATGGARGELDVWTWTSEWRQQRVRSPQLKPERRVPESVLHGEESIAGIVAPASSAFLMAVTTGGKLVRWSSDGIDEVWELPERGSPRSLAAHPEAAWVAVGTKQGDFADPNAGVVIVDLE
jgi:hypothetical protein